ncbi:MAG: nicotinate phosphoribosyltransferase, partial [Planctomycetaceae bacterium]|nr:nicotinate phosphoribosyltransferase [Planctomycetaceae bacterium]
ALRLIESLRFSEDDLDYLQSLTGRDGRPLFDQGFLNYLRQLRPTVDVAAIPEGTVVFPHEPLLRICGPILQCQLLETALLNIVNFQTLIATKASRIVSAAAGDTVLEFGLRRAQGPDGGLSASRAAYVGGCTATSNVLAGRQFGIPVKGTHAHSWVMSFDDEQSAFDAYAAAMPNNCVFLVDTYDTLRGVKNAIRTARWLSESGHRLMGIRLDSGDLHALSLAARHMLDEAGFSDASIVASNDLDEFSIGELKQRGAAINVWGVGTRLVTAHEQSALGGVYKLGAIQDDQGAWQARLKRSEQAVKTSIPGILQVRRFLNEDGVAVGDVICNELQAEGDPRDSRSLSDPDRILRFDQMSAAENLLVPVMKGGQVSIELPALEAIRRRTLQQLNRFPAAVLQFADPDIYDVGLEKHLAELRARLASANRTGNSIQ